GGASRFRSPPRRSQVVGARVLELHRRGAEDERRQVRQESASGAASAGRAERGAPLKASKAYGRTAVGAPPLAVDARWVDRSIKSARWLAYPQLKRLSRSHTPAVRSPSAAETASRGVALAATRRKASSLAQTVSRAWCLTTNCRENSPSAGRRSGCSANRRMSAARRSLPGLPSPRPYMPR